MVHVSLHYATTYNTAAIFFSSTVTKEGTILGIRDVMVFVANLCTHCTHSHPVIHLASVAVVPVLVHELFLRHSECAELVTKRILILRDKMTTRIILHVHVAFKETVKKEQSGRCSTIHYEPPSLELYSCMWK